MRISIHGFIGYAIMTAESITDALILANRFIQLRLPFLQLFFSTFGNKATIQLQTDIELEPIRSEISIALMFGLISIGKGSTGVEDSAGD